MKLVFQKEYLSIKNFNSVELPDFVVLTGVNGSGKSHLLEALENRSASLDNQPSTKIVRFDYLNFYLDKESTYNARQIIDERNNAWGFFQSNIKNQIQTFKTKLEPHYKSFVEISNLREKNLLNLTEKDIGEVELYKKYKVYRQEVRNFFNQESFKNNQQSHAILPIALTLSYSLDEITKEDFDDIFKPYQLKNDFLPHQLGKVIWNYFLKYRNNEINEYQNEKHDKNYPVLSNVEFEKVHGKKPWEIINNILDKFGTIEYRVPSPEGSDYYSDFEFRLEHQNTSLKIDFSGLSSGEKVLMALVASIYKVSSDRQFPDILLLDEIDASLHPSMIKNLLDTINEIFLENETKVILVTHSPTTIALVPEEAVFIMNKEGLNRLVKKSRNDALSILTEGFATLDEGLKIFDEIGKHEVSIISEGDNIRLIKKALEMNNISNVGVITGVESVSSANQLRTIFEFLSRITHQKKVLVVWDPEINFNLTERNNTYQFILPKNSNNKLANKGIENLFNENLFIDFVTTVQDSRGNEIKTFDSKRKKDFTNFILSRNKKEDFVSFEPLIAKIIDIVGVKSNA